MTNNREHPDYFNNLLYGDDSEDDEEDENAIILFLAAASENRHRARCYVRDRLDWNNHVATLFEEGQMEFYHQYRMEYASFVRLCSLLDPFLRVDPVYSRNRTGKEPILTEIVVHCLLRWLAGGSYLDIRLSAGISKASFYACVHRCVDAILYCGTLAYHFPNTAREISEAAGGFKEHSSNGILDGCVGCLDGLLVRIQTPSAREVGNVKAFFSGHYRAYGVNVQAVCDSRCRFIYVAVAAPGGTNDGTAFRKTSLYNLVESLPLGKYIVADSAYVCTEHVLTPFPGEQRMEARKDAYNFYLSQLRIQIEMTFGRLVAK